MKSYLILFLLFVLSCQSNQDSSQTETINPIEAIVDTTSNGIEMKVEDTPDESIILSEINCDYSNLSNQFDLSLDFKYYEALEYLNDSNYLSITIRKRSSKLVVDSIVYRKMPIYHNLYKDCNDVSSYSTNFNTNDQGVDNFYGDIVIADFNFDKKDDIAFIYDSGGNSGPHYAFFLQQDNFKFQLDSFLTDSMTFFPQIIDRKKRQLITYAHAGANHASKVVYQLNKSTNQWKQISKELLGD